MPSYPEWRIHGEETVASYLPESDFKGILQKRLAVPPDHLAILIRDGKVEFAEEGAHLAVGGIFQTFKNFIGGRHALRMLVADLKPFPVTTTINGLTRDQTEVSGDLVIEFQLDPSKPTNIMGLVTDGCSLTRSDIYERLHLHLEARDLLPQLAEHDVSDLRANVGLQDSLQAHISSTTNRIVGDMGLQVRAVSIRWGLTDEERAQIAERQQQREDNRLEAEHKRQLRTFERSAEVTTFQLQTDHDLEKFKVASDAELAEMLLGNEIRLDDVRSTEDRRQEMVSTAHGIEVAREKRKAHQEELLANTEGALERKHIELAINKLEAEARTEQQRIDLALQEDTDLSKLRVADKAWEGQRTKLTELQELELDKNKRLRELNQEDFQMEHQAGMEELRLKNEMELELLKQKGSMTEDQLLAIQAGASPDVAKIFAERAKASSGEDKEALLREMVSMQQENQNRGEERVSGMFDKAMDSMAKAATGKRTKDGSDSEDDDSKVECTKCHHKVPQGDRFCKVCGTQMRT